MRRLLLITILSLPITLFAQWSIVPSGSVGMSDFRLEYKETSDFSPAVSFNGDVSLRYSIPYSFFYISAGAGYLHYKSDNDAIPPLHPELEPNYIEHAYFDESLSALYIPVMAGFYLPDRKLSPVVEAGGMLSFVLDTGDFTEASKADKKSTILSFVAGAGARYKLYKDNALEVKLRYTQSTNMLKLSGSHWSNFSLNVAYAIML